MDPLKNALPVVDPNNPPEGGTPPAGGGTPPAAPTPPALSPESTKILETLQGMNETVQGIKSEWDDFKDNYQTPPAAAPAPGTPPAGGEPAPTWKPKSWDDFPALAEQKASEAVQKVLDDAKAAKDQADKADQEISNEIDTQVASLEAKGKLPPVGNASDPNDPGRRARAELYGLASRMGTMNLEMVADTMTQLHSTGMHYDFKSNSWQRTNPKPAGQIAPVGSSQGSGGAMGSEGPSYDTIHKARSLSELARRAGM